MADKKRVIKCCKCINVFLEILGWSSYFVFFSIYGKSTWNSSVKGSR